MEQEMATHSSIIAWKIPWTEKPGELKSMGLQRVRHNWMTNTHYIVHQNYTILYCTGVLYSDWQFLQVILHFGGFSGGLDGKEPACNARDLGSISGLGKSPRGGHDNPF